MPQIFFNENNSGELDRIVTEMLNRRRSDRNAPWSLENEFDCMEEVEVVRVL